MIQKAHTVFWNDTTVRRSEKGKVGGRAFARARVGGDIVLAGSRRALAAGIEE